MGKKSLISIISLCVLMSVLTVFNISGVSAEDEKYSNGPEVTDYFTVIDENGEPQIIYFDDIEDNEEDVEKLTKEYKLIVQKDDEREVVETFETLEEAKQAQKEVESIQSFSRTRSVEQPEYLIEEKEKTITYGVAYIAATSKGKSYVTYNNLSNPGYDGYTTGSYAKDAAYIETTSSGKIKAMQSGVIMELNKDDVTIVDYKDANISYYIVQNGYLYHKFYYGTSGKYNTYRVGYKLSYLNENVKYYSYDGHYFYKDYPTMIKDYQDDVRTHSVNPKSPYYNYYQYLSHRTQTTLKATDLDSIVNDKVGTSNSKMKNLGKSFISHQNTYGVNALLMFGVAGNESAWGKSSIANNKNNLFGHGAVDSNPYYGANGYESPADSIKYHAEKFISTGYLDNEDWRYNGGHLGDKVSGVNVRYASDPYWGEKAASVNYYYDIDIEEDYGRYTIGIINGVQKNYKMYKEPSLTASVTHVLGAKNDRGVTSPRTYNLPVVILDTVTDSSGNQWYKIQSDTALNSNRTDTKYNNQYDFERDYLYIPVTGVIIVSKGEVNVPTYLTGDVNGDGKVSSLDYIQIKNHIMNSKILSGASLLRADVNGDGKVSSLDYIKIKNHIMGTNKLF